MKGMGHNICMSLMVQCMLVGQVKSVGIFLFVLIFFDSRFQIFVPFKKKYDSIDTPIFLEDNGGIA